MTHTECFYLDTQTGLV